MIKVRPLPGVKIIDMYHYLIPILNKKSDYIVLHFGTNDAVNTKATAIVPVEMFCKREIA